METQDKYIKSAAIIVWFAASYLDCPKLMLCKRLPSCKRFVGRWGTAGGKVDKGECIIRAAQRELQEEAGIYIGVEDIRLLDSHFEEDFKCFVFETHLGMYRFNDIKNLEPKKHSKWQLFTVDEALSLPTLMPALRKILLTKKQGLKKIS